MKEWLAYHCLLGVEHFYIYDYTICGNVREGLGGFAATSNITILRTGSPALGEAGVSSEVSGAYAHCLKTFHANSRWLGFIAANEYLVPMQDGDIRVALAEFEPYGALALSPRITAPAPDSTYFKDALPMGIPKCIVDPKLMLERIRPEAICAETLPAEHAATEPITAERVTEKCSTRGHVTIPHSSVAASTLSSTGAGGYSRLLCYAVNDAHLPVPLVSPAESPAFYHAGSVENGVDTSELSSGKLLRLYRFPLSAQQASLEPHRVSPAPAVNSQLFNQLASLTFVNSKHMQLLQMQFANSFKQDKMPTAPFALSESASLIEVTEAVLSFIDAKLFEKAQICLCHARVRELAEDADFWALRATLALLAKRQTRAEFFIKAGLERKATTSLYKLLEQLFILQGKKLEAEAVVYIRQRLTDVQAEAV